MELSLQKKAILLIISSIAFISTISVIYFGGVIKTFQNEQCEIRIADLANAASICLDLELLERYRSKVQAVYGQAAPYVSNESMGTEEYEAYISQFTDLEKTEDFQKLYDGLRRLLNATTVDCLYLCYVDENTKAAVYLVDAGDKNICHPGSFDYLIGDDLNVLSNPERNLEASLMSQDVYGEITASAIPLHDEIGNVIAYLGVDINVGHLANQRGRMLLNTVLTILVVSLMIGALSLYVSDRMLVRPLNVHQELMEENEKLKKTNLSLARRARAAQKVSDLQKSISSLLAHMPAMTFSKDVENGRYLACNQMFADYVGKKTPAHVVGLTNAELFDQASASRLQEDDVLALSLDEPYTFHEEATDSDGNKRYLQTTKFKFTDTSGRLCLLGMSVDVTELVMVKAENAKNIQAYEAARKESLTYSHIARALSADYSYLYYVDIGKDRFLEYRSSNGKLDMDDGQEGEDFFQMMRNDALDSVYPEDHDRFFKSFTKEKILAAIKNSGHFTLTYRLMVDKVPTYFNLKAIQPEWDEIHIIIGINNTDAEMKAREDAERIKTEQAIYERIAALSGQYLCIYSIDPVNGRYTEHAATHDYDSLQLSKEGDNFFDKIQQESPRVIFHDDLNQCLKEITRVNILSEIKTTGLFSIEYRLMLGDECRFVNMRAALIHEKNKTQLIVGIIDVDAQKKREQEYALNLKLAKEQANFDSLTGVRNKFAFAEIERQLNLQIEGRVPPQLAVVVCDVNGLKQVNDTLGHKAGDQLIQQASQEISDVFHHDNVFRIGGDEFAVLLIGEGCSSLEGQMRKMNEMNIENMAHGGVVIACGMSTYQPGDGSVAEIFDRADQEMYINKAALKGGRDQIR